MILINYPLSMDIVVRKPGKSNKIIEAVGRRAEGTKLEEDSNTDLSGYVDDVICPHADVSLQRLCKN